MNADFAQRRRVALALAITVILVPAAFLLNRGDDGSAGEPLNTLVGPAEIPGVTTEDDDTSSPAGGASGTDPMGTTPDEALHGTVPEQANDPATIAIPRAGRAERGTASFSRSIGDPQSCQIRDLGTIPFLGEVTITNLDNSRSVRCIADIVDDPPDEAVILSTEAFLQIGDLTDAPLSVEITW